MTSKEVSQHITEETLHAWLDSELGRRESGAVSEHLQHCRTCGELLDECREMRTTVSQLLGSYDAELSEIPRATRSARARLTLSSRVASAPIISHIVADSQPVRFWPSARKFGSMAALALVFVAAASLVMVRGYHTVAGSISTVAKSHYAGPVWSSKKDVTLTGVVKSLSGKGIEGAVVSVSGTKLKVVTDQAGQFKIRGVPKSTKSIGVNGPPGYGAYTEYFDLKNSVEPVVNIVLQPSVLRLDPMVVTTTRPSWSSAPVACLTSFEPYTVDSPRMFQMLRGPIRSSGIFRLDVVGWPEPGITVSAVFSLESDGTIFGRVRDKSSDLRITLTRDGQEWRGSASETRNQKSRWRRVAMRESSCKL